MQRDFWSPDLSPASGRTEGEGAGGGGEGARSLPLVEEGGVAWASDRTALRKTVSVDERLLQVTAGEQPHLRLLRRLERGRKKLRSIQVSSCRSPDCHRPESAFISVGHVWIMSEAVHAHTTCCKSALIIS